MKPPPQVWAEAIMSSMKGLGTSDNLLINWMCIAKERMDEARTSPRYFPDICGRALKMAGLSPCSTEKIFLFKCRRLIYVLM